MALPSRTEDRAAFDSEALLARCLGKIELAERILAKFNSRVDLDIAELERALASDDLNTIAQVAHRLKGASANVAADALKEKAAGIEELARRGCAGEIPNCMEGLRGERNRFAQNASKLAFPPVSAP